VGMEILMGIPMEILMGIPTDMGMGTVVNPHGPVGILWGFLDGYEIKQKLVKYAIHVIVDV